MSNCVFQHEELFGMGAYILVQLMCNNVVYFIIKIPFLSEGFYFSWVDFNNVAYLIINSIFLVVVYIVIGSISNSIVNFCMKVSFLTGADTFFDEYQVALCFSSEIVFFSEGS